MQQYRLGTVPYLNAKPLVYAFEQSAPPNVTLIEEIPSRLVESLRAGRVDAALVSSITCLEDGGLVPLPCACIASQGAVDSIRLFCKVPPERVRRVALDSSSRTSVALARILLIEAFGAHPECVTMPPDLPAMLREADAGLLIGDPAMRAFHCRPDDWAGARSLDLGEVWRQMTGLPFVYAVWVAQRDADLAGLDALLAAARDAGRPHLDAMAADAHCRLGLPESVCRRYLHDIMCYDFGDREREGLRRFRELALRHGLLPANAPPWE